MGFWGPFFYLKLPLFDFACHLKWPDLHAPNAGGSRLTPIDTYPLSASLSFSFLPLPLSASLCLAFACLPAFALPAFASAYLCLPLPASACLPACLRLGQNRAGKLMGI